ncbi:MAG: DoxX family protein [Paludibacterium sp.]|uniref:DoxX family protein n=1 Tax=Paludibacterium sp. TaxID=1917523 RepID=UPI0025F7CC68|nr:DoxX family protein [Paludibacterium sp.]MBV8047989.1 DoxX family protein [Paludibacterium sp.]MBV8649157.1 DoxX family protein [Paludibacterium sp.]
MNPNPKLASLTLRVALGLMYLAHGATKLFVFTPAGTAKFFMSLGLPGFVGYLAIVAELSAAGLLLSGVKARWAAIALVPLLAGTIVLVHGANGWMFTNPGGGWEYPAFMIAASLALFFLSDGKPRPAASV